MTESTYIRISLIAFLVVLSAYFLPDVLTGFEGAASTRPYSWHSYLAGTQLTLMACLLFFPGALICRWVFGCKPVSLLWMPFGTVCIGLIGLFAYVYCRSLINTLAGIPLTATELLLISLLTVIPLLKQGAFPVEREHLLHLPLAIFAFWILAVAAAQHELPRDIMLSSDPDQHAFFAVQIAALGGVPFSQGAWGDLSFGYPAGTGVLIFIFSTLSFISVAGATAIIPTIQAYFVIFLLCEITLFKTQSARIRILLMLTGILIFHYLLTYGFEPAHYHLEGFGRLSSLWLYALGLGACLLAHRDRNPEQRSLKFIGLGVVAICVGIVINPVNAFVLTMLFSLGFVIRFPRKIYQLFALLTIPALICIDPYFLELFTGTQSRHGMVLLGDAASLPPLNEVLLLSFQRFFYWYKQTDWFFSINYLPHALLIAFCFMTALSLLLKQNENTPYRFLLVLLLIYASWIVLTPFFETMTLDARFRLLMPYFQNSKSQALYVLLFSLAAFNAYKLIGKTEGWYLPLFSIVLFGYGLALMQDQLNAVNKSTRAGYCGSMGCLSMDDRKVLEESEALFRNHDNSDRVPRMLVPNAVSIHGDEKWLMPRGGARSAIFYDTFPLAFFYYKGSAEYTNDNYSRYVCESLDVDWLRQRNIQFLFDPTDKLDSCVHDRELLDSNFPIVASAGTSRIYRLWNP